MLDRLLDAFAYPVSVLMNLLHDLLSRWLAPDSGAAWVVSVVLLVCVVRLILLRPTWRQLWSARRTAQLQPQLRALKHQHGKDQLAYARAARELQRSEGVGVAAGLLPLLLQLPVLVGLYHLLVDFTVLGAAGGNGVFSPDQVHSFASATVLGVPLSAAIRTPVSVLAALQPGLTALGVVSVVLPLLLVAALATFVNAWHARQRPVALTDEDNPLADTMRRMTRAMVWLAPLGVLVGGVVVPLPVALALYWAVNGTWTTVQTVLMTKRLDRLLPLPEAA
jgi:YidC/Oxa1 family membrane protein insertase